jgi:type IV secretory pathway TrbD component
MNGRKAAVIFGILVWAATLAGLAAWNLSSIGKIGP